MNPAQQEQWVRRNRGAESIKARQERARCPVCGQTVATYVPKRGDGSQRNAYRHLPDGLVATDHTGVWCGGSNREVPAVSYGNPSRSSQR